ncbi:hypothetical protein AAFF_G00164060 [Aldrovandia affinis]|uniref:Uncharacterized protein n=1 Tax=Aldrovandia affinis TaxID=143900 RepID=A0AAD7WWJ1_9TELE|nr:hypothetical protein AAFF_G00164060 [Aldrovandia affinis]
MNNASWYLPFRLPRQKRSPKGSTMPLLASSTPCDVIGGLTGARGHPKPSFLIPSPHTPPTDGHTVEPPPAICKLLLGLEIHMGKGGGLGKRRWWGQETEQEVPFIFCP